MTVLIVDDDQSMLEMLSQTIEWKSLDVDNVLTAVSAAAAKKVYLSQPVDIMICDIEMPGESGIDLLSWVREQEFETLNIFLTNHQKFSYAQTAIKLDTVDFIGKMAPPEELHEAIRKAVNIAKTKRVQKRYLDYGRYWEENKGLLWRQFWEDLISEKIPPNAETIYRIAGERLKTWYGADPSVKSGKNFYVPILITVLLAQDAIEGYSSQELDYCIFNVTAEVLYGTTNSDHIVSLGQENGRAYYVVMLDIQDAPGVSKKLIELTSLFKEYLLFSVNIYLGERVSIEQISAAVRELKKKDVENVLQRGGVHLPSSPCEKQETTSDAPKFDTEKLTEYLESGQNFQAVTLVKDYFSSLPRSQIGAPLLQEFRTDYMQTLYSFMDRRHISAHQLLSQPGADALSKGAADSLISMMKWVSFSVNAVITLVKNAGHSNSVVETVKAYIEENYASHLTKADFAEQVFLNPDYLAKLFKKETGVALLDYLTEVRINKAKILLEDASVPLTDVAIRTGFDYYSYFSTIFKKTVGMSPSDFRKMRLTQ